MNVLFVCTGNICRSPMAEFMLKDMVTKLHCADDFRIASAAITTEEIGNPIYPPAKKKLAENGIGVPGNELGVFAKRARQMTRRDYREYDHLIGMDDWHVRGMTAISGGDPEGKIHKLLDFTDTGGSIADPWYTRDFETAYREIELGLQGFLSSLGY